MQNLSSFIQEQSGRETIYPPEDLIFEALACTSFNDVRVVIVGQDPYHGPLQACGLSFSVPETVAIPPSLKNIFKEIESDLGIKAPQSGSLHYLARQGVLLLNATLTVSKGKPGSHQGRGWEHFTDGIIKVLAEREKPVVFLLWGRFANEKCEKFLKHTSGNYAILKAPHPSPFSAYSGFFGCRHFSKTNEILDSWGEKKIEWCGAETSTYLVNPAPSACHLQNQEH